jgi:sodium/hydrogen antiporter
MQTFSAGDFALILAVVGVVVIVAALISGLIERYNFPQVAVFLGLGAILGAPGLGLIDVGLDSPVLRVVATLSLTLVLFTDAVGLSIKETRQHAKLVLLLLGPGALLFTALAAGLGWWLLGLSVPAAVIVGAALASTDPVLLRGFVKMRNVSATARQALRLESGLNDVTLLPVVLIAMAFVAGGSAEGAEGGIDWGKLFIELFLLGPGAGAAIGLLAVATLDMVRHRVGIRRDYEALYSLGVAFAAFAAAEAVHGSGFLAAFAAGITIAALDVELCDCFLEYGETTAEMALLFTFVLFGSSLIWTGFGVFSLAALAFAVLVLALRPLAYSVALLPSRLARKDRLLISWFGPRGLSTLLLVLLPVFAGTPDAPLMFQICALVVLLSVVVHGGSAMLVARKKGGGAVAERPAGVATIAASPSATLFPDGAVRADGNGHGTEPDRREVVPMPLTMHNPHSMSGVASRLETDGSEPSGDEGEEGGSRERITLDEVLRLERSGERVILVDARTERTHMEIGREAEGTLRLVPTGGQFSTEEQARALMLPRDALIAVFCA